MKVINRPQTGWYSLKSQQRVSHGASRSIRRAGRIHRQCMCTIGFGLLHEWGDACDRSGTLAATVDGWPATVEHVWMGGVPITEIEALSLMGQENMYV